jgi:OOP family OmpA-OmpF porin
MYFFTFAAGVRCESLIQLQAQSRRNMNKPSKFALALAFAAISATGVASAQTVDNWKNGSNELIWKNGSNELCWQNNFWTPATAAAECVKKSGQPMSDKVSIKAEALFDFDKAIVKPEGRKLLDQVVGRAQAVNLETIIAIGHTDSIGSDAYNQALSVRRAEAVKAYLVTKGVAANRITASGKGKSQPVADNRTAAGREKNRRVDVEIIGSKK